MAAKQTAPAPEPLPPGADDLELINGIGPVNARRLYAIGVTTFAQLAALQPEELVRRLNGQTGLTVTRIIKDDWIGQAARLAAARPAVEVVEASAGMIAGPVASSPAEAPQQLHPSFRLSFVLNPDQSVERTLFTYTLPEGVEKQVSWTGWDADQLLKQIIRRSKLRLADVERASSLLSSTPEASAPMPVDAVPVQISPRERAEAALAAAAAPTLGPRLRSSALVAPPGDERRRLVSELGSYRVALELELGDTLMEGERPVQYLLTIYARPMGSLARQQLGSASGSIGSEGVIQIVTAARRLRPGLFRLEVDLQVSAASDAPPGPTSANLRGDLVCIY